jgi:hypothetical protein
LREPEQALQHPSFVPGGFFGYDAHSDKTQDKLLVVKFLADSDLTAGQINF